MKVLVTGGAGFIGSYLCQALHDSGHHLRVVDCAKKNRMTRTFDFITLNIQDKQGLEEAMKGVDLVLHLAAKHKYFGVSEKEFFIANEEGTKNVLSAMAKEGVRQIIFFSTVAVYGETIGPTDESVEPRATTPYGLSKLAAESWVKKWASEDSMRTAIILRPTVIFGPRNKGNIYRLIRQIYYRGYFPIGEGDNIKSIAYIENVIKATIFLISLDLKGCHIFNYSDQPHLSYKEILNIIYTELGRKAPQYFLPVSPMIKISRNIDKIIRALGIKFSFETTIKKMNKQTYYNSEKIMNLGFRPTYSSIEGLRRMVRWYLEEKNQKRRDS